MICGAIAGGAFKSTLGILPVLFYIIKLINSVALGLYLEGQASVALRMLLII